MGQRPPGNLVDMCLTFFLRQGGGLYRRFDERQRQRAHTQEELRDYLKRAALKGLHFMATGPLRRLSWGRAGGM